jgi:hypothetical protein
MKNILFGFLLLLATTGLAQEATLNIPVTRPSEAKLGVKEVNIRQTQVVVSLSVQASTNDEIRYYNVAIPDITFPSATVVGFITAIGTTRPTETGTALRRFQFRVLGYLSDNGYLSGVTLVP